MSISYYIFYSPTRHQLTYYEYFDFTNFIRLMTFYSLFPHPKLRWELKMKKVCNCFIYLGEGRGTPISYLRGRNFAGITFRKFFLWHFLRLGLRKDFIHGNQFLQKQIFCWKKFHLCLQEHFSMTLLYGFENDLYKNYYLFTNDKITDGLEKTQFRRHCIRQKLSIFKVHYFLKYFAWLIFANHRF